MILLNNFEDLLKGADPKQLEEAIKKFQAFSSTEAGQKIISQMKDSPDISNIQNAKGVSEYVKNNPDMVNKLLDIFKNK